MLNSSTPQQDLRTPVPRRPTLRLAATSEHHATIAAHLTVRDRWLARMIAEHRVLTSTQITQLAFPSRRATNLRLNQLYRWRLLDRFQPYIGRGRAPMFYVLDIAGAHVLAHEDGIDPAVLKFRPERSIGIAHSIRLAHLHGVNSFFAPLVRHARHHAGTSVSAWWPETRCARHFGDIVRPDAYGRWTENGHSVEWFLEWDTGSYQLARLAAKLPGYATLATTTKIITPLLFCFASAHREAHAREILEPATRDLARPGDIPIATTSLDELHHDATAADTVWLPLHHTTPGRRRLVDLPATWPQVTEPATATDDVPSGNTDGRPVRLLPPRAMPPWSGTSDLTWNETR